MTAQISLALKFVFLLVGILSLAYVGAFSVEAQPLTTLAVGYPARSIGSIQLYIAQERGFFREEGLQVNLTQIRGDVAKAGNAHGRSIRLQFRCREREGISSRRAA